MPPATVGSPARTFVVVDQDVLGDRRVESVLEAAGPSAQLLDVRNFDRLHWWQRSKDAWRASALLLASFGGGLERRRRLARQLRPRHHVFAGLGACLKWTARAVAASRELERSLSVLAAADVVHVHANDLAAGLAVALLRSPHRVRFVYDSHELQIHRQRRAGWLRILAEHAQEQRVLERAEEVRTVNRAIADAMQVIHPALRSRPPRVLANDWYPHHRIVSAPASARPALVYVGRATHGRQLHRLGRPDSGFDTYGWLLGGATAPLPRGGHWRYAGSEYEAELEALRRERRCLMWCCLDSHALSYRLATPNKLFQALALGIPVLASPGTYLADLVGQHGIGVVDNGDLPRLTAEVRSARFDEWQENIDRFRRALREGCAQV